MSRTLVDCDTCGDKLLMEEQQGYYVECKACRDKTPGKALKRVRNCSICGVDIITFGVNGAVRLVCASCATKDPLLLGSEKIARERDGFRKRVEELNEHNADLRTQLHSMKATCDSRMRELEVGLKAENERLKNEIEHKDENDLAARLQTKLRMQYGETDKQKLLSFMVWLRRMIENETGVGDFKDEEIVGAYCRGVNRMRPEGLNSADISTSPTVYRRAARKW